MPLVLPYPNHPANGDTFDATPVTTNINAIAAAIQSFDGSQIAAGTVGASALATAINPQTFLKEIIQPFVASGLVWTAGSGLTAGMTAGVVYVTTPASIIVRVSVLAVSSYTFTASTDTYIDVDYNGNFTYTAVANNAASPSLAANSLRVAIVVTGASAISSINQGQETMVLPIASSVPYAVTDSLGNLICPRDPNRKILGYRQAVSSQGTSSSSAVQVTALSCPVIVPSNRRVRVSFMPATLSAAGTAVPIITLWDGTVGSGTQLSLNQAKIATSDISVSIDTAAIVTPSATSKTYNAGFQSQGAASTVTIGSSSTAPSYIMVELV